MLRRSLLLAAILCPLLLTVLTVERSAAGDWPQILGPNRNGEATGESISDSWPKSGPTTLWQRRVGSGFAGVAVAGGTVVLFHRQGDEEIVEGLQARSGEPIWKTGFPTDYAPRFSDDDGPRSVPLIHNGRVYVYGVQGGLRCLDLKTGREVWSRATHKDYQAREGYFGAGSTPIIEGERILVNVGGARADAGIVAFAIDSGETVWKATRNLAGYSSPVATTIDGVRHVIFVTRYNTVSIDPATGETRFEIPFGQRGPTVNAASPTVIDSQLFLTASYGVGAVFADVGTSEATVRWRSDEIMSSQYTTCIHDSGYLYGIHGRQDVGIAELRCFEPGSQKIQWTKRGFGYATLIKADGKLLILKTGGELVLAKLIPAQYRELAGAAVFPAGSETRALPALADGLLYARDSRTLKCVDLRKSKTGR